MGREPDNRSTKYANRSTILPLLGRGPGWGFGVRLLGWGCWPVCKTYAYWLFWNSLENILLINVQTIANQPEYHKIL